MQQNFTIQDDIYLVLNNAELDLHNDFDLLHLTYDMSTSSTLTLGFVANQYNSRQANSALDCTFAGIWALSIQGNFQQHSGLDLDFVGYVKATETEPTTARDEVGFYDNEHLVFSFISGGHIRIGYTIARAALTLQS